MADFAIRRAVDLDVIQTLETMQSPRPLPILKMSPGDNVESGVASIDPSGAPLSNEFPCPDDRFKASKDQTRCVPSLDRDAVETFDPYPAKIPLNVQITSRIHEDQQMLRFNYLGDFFPRITISGPSVPVATRLRRVF
jgi:hypothetical protein